MVIKRLKSSWHSGTYANARFVTPASGETCFFDSNSNPVTMLSFLTPSLLHSRSSTVYLGSEHKFGGLPMTKKDCRKLPVSLIIAFRSWKNMALHFWHIAPEVPSEHISQSGNKAMHTFLLRPLWVYLLVIDPLKLSRSSSRTDWLPWAYLLRTTGTQKNTDLLSQ